jgi:hypothetical protein
LHRYLLENKNTDPFYGAMVSMITYKGGLILTQESVREPLNQDLSEDQKWNWKNDEKLFHHDIVRGVLGYDPSEEQRW